MTDRSLRILMIVSLVVNLFLAGAVAGLVVVGSRLLDQRSEMRRAERPSVFVAFRDVPEDRRRELRQIMRDEARRVVPEFQAARESRRAAAQAISAAQYDAAAAEAALRAAREQEFKARAALDAAFARRLSDLSPQERAAFAEMMLRGPRGPQVRIRREGGPPRPPPLEAPPRP